MAASSLGSLNFLSMQPCPTGPQQQIVLESKAGVAGHGAFATGIRSAPQQVTTVVDVTSMANGVTLLATYANRHDEAQRKHARIVVRSTRPYDPARTKFLTLSELRVKRSNVGG
jgi:hypothetical protein